MQVNQMYRKTTLGLCLSDAIDDLVVSGVMPPHAVERVWNSFDKAFQYALNTKVKSKTAFKGHLKTFKYVDNVWQFTLEKSHFRTDSETIACPEDVKIVCTDIQLTKTSALAAALAKA